ncbi:MAG: prephenate dehydratase [Archaeoglobi archaeon]|nr:prephenate dehydratase [Candidatus Mnemosynella bozhongmuii]
MRVGVLGPQGTYSEKAALKKFPRESLVYFKSITEIVERVSRGELERGVIPVENSLEGGVSETLDALVEYDVGVVDEILLEIRHCLVAKDDSEITVILSHPQALAQCRKFLNSRFPNVELREATSTMHAAKIAQEIKGVAAIAPCDSAEKYGLKIIERDIQDGENITRFFVISKKPSLSGKKSSIIVFPFEDRPGTLLRILKPFADEGINLTKIESRPTKKKLGEYLFFIDFQGSLSDERVLRAIEEIRKISAVKILGSYS